MIRKNEACAYCCHDFQTEYEIYDDYSDFFFYFDLELTYFDSLKVLYAPQTLLMIYITRCETRSQYELSVSKTL